MEPEVVEAHVEDAAVYLFDNRCLRPPRVFLDHDDHVPTCRDIPQRAHSEVGRSNDAHEHLSPRARVPAS